MAFNSDDELPKFIHEKGNIDQKLQNFKIFQSESNK